MSAKTHYLLTSGQVRGLYGCGFRWWVQNPGKNNGWRGRRFIHMHFQGIHNKEDARLGLHGSQVHEVLLGVGGYLQNIWKGGLKDAVEPAAVTLDVDAEYRYDRRYCLHAEGCRCVWTPYTSAAQAADSSAAAGWHGHEGLVQFDWAAGTLERQKDVRVLLARLRGVTRHEDDEARPRENRSATMSLLLFEPWQWASFHAALYSLCAPYMYGAPE